MPTGKRTGSLPYALPTRTARAGRPPPRSVRRTNLEQLAEPCTHRLRSTCFSAVRLRVLSFRPAVGRQPNQARNSTRLQSPVAQLAASGEALERICDLQPRAAPTHRRPPPRPRRRRLRRACCATDWPWQLPPTCLMAWRRTSLWAPLTAQRRSRRRWPVQRRCWVSSTAAHLPTTAAGRAATARSSSSSRNSCGRGRSAAAQLTARPRARAARRRRLCHPAPPAPLASERRPCSCA